MDRLLYSLILRGYIKLYKAKAQRSKQVWQGCSKDLSGRYTAVAQAEDFTRGFAVSRGVTQTNSYSVSSTLFFFIKLFFY